MLDPLDPAQRLLDLYGDPFLDLDGRGTRERYIDLHLLQLELGAEPALQVEERKYAREANREHQPVRDDRVLYEVMDDSTHRGGTYLST